MTDDRPSSHRIFLALGCASAAIGVAAGAFGAHGLKSVLSAAMLDVYETAVRYQMYHAFGLVAAAWVVSLTESPRARLGGWCFMAGTLLFSGSLYMLALTDMRWLGAITPFGGLAFIAGWLLIAFAAGEKRKEP